MPAVVCLVPKDREDDPTTLGGDDPVHGNVQVDGEQAGGAHQEVIGEYGVNPAEEVAFRVGSEKVNTVLPGSESTAISPCIASASSRAIARPRPLPDARPPESPR